MGNFSGNAGTKNSLISQLKMSLLSVVIGLLGAVVGSAFSHTLTGVAHLREAAGWLIFLLPLGGIATVGLYRLCRITDHSGTNHILRSALDNGPIRALNAPAIFVSTAITHLLGGSAGKEGAAIQLGGAGASALADLFRLKDRERTVLILSGMSAVFAGVFGTPFTAAIFILEFRSSLPFFALLPCLISSIIASQGASWLGVAGESVHVVGQFAFTLPTVARLLLLAICLCAVGALMCLVFHKGEHLAQSWIRNPYLRIVIGSVAVILLTLLVGDMRYNGPGMHMALGAVEGHAQWYDFLLKMLFTAITLSAGFKGGEIVPTFCIGATFG